LTHRLTTARKWTSRIPGRTIIGLTGPIAAGKSTVAAQLAERGALTIDADAVYRTLLQPGSPLSRQVAEAFGPRVVADNAIDRAALGDIVFGDPGALATLERITHPAVEASIVEELEQDSASLVVIEAVKLIQSGLVNLVDSLWVVTARPEVRQYRLVEGRGLTVAAARARMAASDSVVPSYVQPDVEIDTSGDLLATRAAVDKALARLLGRKYSETESERSVN
jgi:dephospho-CoA kinase